MRSKPIMRNRYMVVIDLILTVIAVLGAYALRLELGALFYFYLPSAYWMIALALLIKIPLYYVFGLYRRLWGYASTRELRLILFAVTSASVLVSVGMVILFSLKVFTGFPRSVLIIDWLLSLILIGGVRFLIRLVSDNISTASKSGLNQQAKRTLIIGAGDAGALVVRELQKNSDLNLIPIGFLDDNPDKMKQQIHGVPVVGTLSEIGKVIEHRRIEEVVIAIPSSSGKVVRMIADVCRLRGIPFRTMPGIYELIGGKVSINRLREVDITDLLRRQPAHMQEELIGQTLTNKRVLVTGAGGSIGRELCRQISRWQPSHLIMVGHGENSIFESLLELQESAPGLTLVPVIADVRDYQRIHNVFSQHKPDIVFHAAAHKHVPLMEMNVDEAIDNNVRGTLDVVRACENNNIQRLVMISTDKAIRPANIMGATKRLSEMIVLDAAQRSGNAYSVVRFGNVLGSRGSVVPLFKHQIANGGPVTVTHPEIIRYFMTIPEAVSLVLEAGAYAEGGEIFILDMGEPVKILDLAKNMIRLSGLTPGEDIEIQFTGLRPGEKLYEELLIDEENKKETKNKRIFIGSPRMMETEQFSELIAELDHAAFSEDPNIREVVKRLVPEYTYKQTNQQTK